MGVKVVREDWSRYTVQRAGNSGIGCLETMQGLPYIGTERTWLVKKWRTV